MRENDLTKLSRQAQYWVGPRFKPPTPHMCIISYTGREPVSLLSFFSRDSYSSIPSPTSVQPIPGVRTPPARLEGFKQIQNIQLQLACHHLRFRMHDPPSLYTYILYIHRLVRSSFSDTEAPRIPKFEGSKNSDTFFHRAVMIPTTKKGLRSL